MYSCDSGRTSTLKATLDKISSGNLFFLVVCLILKCVSFTLYTFFLCHLCEFGVAWKQYLLLAVYAFVYT